MPSRRFEPDCQVRSVHLGSDQGPRGHDAQASAHASLPRSRTVHGRWEADQPAREIQGAESMTERFERGLAILRRIGGEDFDGPVNRLAQISPDLARFTVEYPYGDVLSRDGLELRVRQ